MKSLCHDLGLIPAMTFTEIARELGYRDPEGAGKTTVRCLYLNGIAKLRERPNTMQKLRVLAAAAAAARHERETGATR